MNKTLDIQISSIMHNTTLSDHIIFEQSDDDISRSSEISN